MTVVKYVSVCRVQTRFDAVLHHHAGSRWALQLLNLKMKIALLNVSACLQGHTLFFSSRRFIKDKNHRDSAKGKEIPSQIEWDQFIVLHRLFIVQVCPLGTFAHQKYSRRGLIAAVWLDAADYIQKPGLLFNELLNYKTVLQKQIQHQQEERETLKHINMQHPAMIMQQHQF